MKNLVRLAWPSMLLLILSSCASVHRVRGPEQGVERQVVEKNYVLGVEKSVYVGQPMIRVRDYWTRRDTTPVLKANKSFTFRYPMFGPIVNVPEGQGFVVVGKQIRDGKTFRLVKIDPAVQVGLLIDDDGKIDGRGVNLTLGVFMGYTYKAEPSDVRLVQDQAETVVSSRGVINYEIIYSGVSKDEVNLLYREFTPDDMARPAFSQNLTYAKDGTHIRFRDFRIQIQDATNESIRFVVEDDGMEPNP